MGILLAQSLFPRVVPLPAEVRSTAVTTEPLLEEQAERLSALTAYDRRRVARTVVQWLNEPPFTARIDNSEQIRALQGEAQGDNNLDEIDAAYGWAIEAAPKTDGCTSTAGSFYWMPVIPPLPDGFVSPRSRVASGELCGPGEIGE